MNSPHTLKGLRKEFKAIGKFHSPQHNSPITSTTSKKH